MYGVFMHLRQRGNSWQAIVPAGTDRNGKTKYRSLTRATNLDAKIDGMALQVELHRTQAIKVDGTVGELLIRFLANRKSSVRGSTYMSHVWAVERLKPLCGVEVR